MRRSSAVDWGLIAKMGAKAERRLVWAFCFSFSEDRRDRSYFFLNTFNDTFKDMFKIRCI